jgi:hypothetical protein
MSGDTEHAASEEIRSAVADDIRLETSEEMRFAFCHVPVIYYPILSLFIYFCVEYAI